MAVLDSRRFRRYVVRVDGADGSGPVGSGFFVAPGWVLTAAHVVSGADRVLIQPDAFVSATPVAATVAARSGPPATAEALWPFPDLAVLSLDGALDHPCVLLDAAYPAGDTDCHAWGYPQRDDRGTAPVGEPAMFGFEGVDRDGFLQLLSGVARRGLSGAPLVCPSRGAVVGVITATRDDRVPTGGWAAPVGALLNGGPGVPDELAAVGAQIAWWNSAAWIEDRPAWDRVIEGDDRTGVPREVTVRRAHRLGSQFAVLALLEAGPAAEADETEADETEADETEADETEAEQRREAIERRKLACRDLCDDLSVPFLPESPRHPQRVDVIVSRIQQAHQLQALIAYRLGADAAAAFRLAFDIGLSPETIPFLPPDQRLDSVRRVAALAGEAELPDEIAARVTEFYSDGTDRGAMLRGAAELTGALSDWWSSRLALDDPWLSGVYLAIWRFTRNAALAAITLSHGASASVVDSLHAKSRRFGDDIDAVPPPLPGLTGEPAMDHAAALHYLLNDLPVPLVSRFGDSYGPGSLRLLRLGTRLWTLPVIYHPDDDLGQSVASIVEEECRALGIPEEVDEELVRTIRAQADFETVKDLVFRFDHAVDRLLSRAG